MLGTPVVCGFQRFGLVLKIILNKVRSQRFGFVENIKQLESLCMSQKSEVWFCREYKITCLYASHRSLRFGFVENIKQLESL